MFLLQSEYHVPGTAAASGMQRPTAHPRYVNMTHQAVTPIDERHSIYYFTAGHRVEDTYEGRTEKQMASVIMAFEEDRAMIEAQQTVIDAMPPTPMVLTSADAAVARFRRVMLQLRQEAEPG